MNAPTEMHQPTKNKIAKRNDLIDEIIALEGDSDLGDFLRTYRKADISINVNMRGDDVQDCEDATYELALCFEELFDDLLNEIEGVRAMS